MKIKDIINEIKVTRSSGYQRPEKYKLIRLIPDLNQIAAGSNGTVQVVRPKRHRQTIHFSINGPVTQHESGDWTNMPIAIIADMAEMGQPGFINFQDTWYYTDKNNRLNLGRPVILAPQGTQAPVGVSLTYYSGNLFDAIEKQLEKDGIQMLNIGSHGPSDFDATGVEHSSNDLYGKRVDTRDEVTHILSKHGYDPDTGQGGHSWTPDSTIEMYQYDLEQVRKYIQSGAKKEYIPKQFSKNIALYPGESPEKWSSEIAAQIGWRLATDLLRTSEALLQYGYYHGLGLPDKEKPVTNPGQATHLTKMIRTANAYRSWFRRYLPKD